MILSGASVFQTRFKHSIFRDCRSQLGLDKEGFQISPPSRAVPSKAVKEDKDSATVRPREAHGTMAALFLSHRIWDMQEPGMGAVLPQPAT